VTGRLGIPSAHAGTADAAGSDRVCGAGSCLSQATLWLYTRGRTEAAGRHFVRAGELAPHDFTIRRGTMPMRGIDPMGPQFREMLGAWVQAGNPYYRPLPE
jgi:hypothetical protein